MSVQNIAVKLCGLLQSQSEEEVTAREWRLVGQEQDGSQLLTWISTKDEKDIMNVGVYTNKTKTLRTLYIFEEKLNIIQASVNSTHSLLAYVVKVLPTDESEAKEALYCPYLVCLLPDKVCEPEVVEEGSTKQIMLQYVYGKSNKYSPGIRNDRFLLFKHLEYIKIYRTPMFLNECDDGTDKWGFDGIYTETEKIVNIFSWAQWDCANQVLFYIHHRAPLQSFAEGEEMRSPAEPAPTLSALQFHADLPHETVLNIPLSLPHAGGAGAACGSYEDDPVPLRVHDCGIDLYILCDQRGVLCICHHYLYKALDDSTSSLAVDDVDKESGVNFAYSVTLLNHGAVLHSVLPDLPWSLAKSLRPSYTLYEENHLLVSIPMLFTHLIDISPHHEPCCHVVLPQPGDSGPSLAPLLGWGPHAMVDLNTLDVATVAVHERDLAATFKSDTVIENKLGIIHYLIQHAGNTELAEELVSWMCVNEPAGGGVQRAMQEYLVGGAYAVTRRSLPPSALPLAAHLPYTVHLAIGDVKAGQCVVHVSLAALWRVAAAVVLSPRQRVCQFAEDAWTRLWAALQRPAPQRLRPSAVAARLAPALACYQPEALSRASTPLSPTTRRPSLAAHDGLPFVELDVCTTSRQEHVIAANMRAVSVHLLHEAGDGGAEGVHALATRWAGAQLDVSRALCRAVARAAAADRQSHQTKGFVYIDELDPAHALVLFKLLEQYYLAAEAVAFPLPQGFASFLTYLGYRALPFHMFMQYVHRNVLELQIDVMKAIIAAKDSSRSVEHKLRLIQLVGEARGRRALSAWPHRAALVLRARDHAHALLSGRPAPPPHRAPHRPHRDTGIAALPSGERLSPLDTFLDLLTAKASLNELDFNLIIEATLASVQDSAA